MATAKEFAIQKFAQDLIGSVDVLELAIDAASKPAAESASESTSAFDTLLEGVKMTQSNLEKTLNRHGVSKFSPLGEKFDPNRHEALFQVPSSAAGPEHNSPNTVMNVQKTVSSFSLLCVRR